MNRVPTTFVQKYTPRAQLKPSGAPEPASGRGETGGLAILEYARTHDIRIDDFIEATASGQASEKRRRLDELTNALQRGDRLVVSELSRLGRSLGQIVTILDALAKAGVAFVALKENIRTEGKRDIQTKVMTTLFALFAEVERDLISERTREGLARARSSGRKLGRPKGSLGVSRLDGKQDEIRRFLELGVSKTAIAKIDHRRVPYCALQLHDHQRAQAEPLACITARMVSVPSPRRPRRGSPPRQPPRGRVVGCGEPGAGGTAACHSRRSCRAVAGTVSRSRSTRHRPLPAVCALPPAARRVQGE